MVAQCNSVQYTFPQIYFPFQYLYACMYVISSYSKVDHWQNFSFVGITYIVFIINSDIPLETAAIFFLANLYLQRGITSEYVMVGFICKGFLKLWGTLVENYKTKSLSNSRIRTLYLPLTNRIR